MSSLNTVLFLYLQSTVKFTTMFIYTVSMDIKVSDHIAYPNIVCEGL